MYVTVKKEFKRGFFFLMIRRPPRSTLFPTRRSSDLFEGGGEAALRAEAELVERRELGGGLDPAEDVVALFEFAALGGEDRKSTRLNSSHANISYAVFCLKKKTDFLIRSFNSALLARS